MDDAYFETWSRHDDKNDLLKLSLTNSDYDPVDVEAACDRASEIVNDSWATKNQYAIPLFESDTGRPTSEYLRYQPDKPHLIFYDSTKGHLVRKTPTDLTTTNLAQRLKWWLPDYHDDIEALDDNKLPPETITATDSISKREVGEWFGDITSVVETEEQADLQHGKEQFASLNIDRAIRNERLKGPFIASDAQHTPDDVFSAMLIASDPDTADEELNLRDDAGIFEDNHYLVVIEGVDSIDPIHMVATDVNTRRLQLEPVSNDIHQGTEAGAHLTDSTTTLWLYPILNPVPYTRRKNAIKSVKADHWKRDILTGNATVGFTPDKYAAPNPAIELNHSQERALVWALAAHDCVCIHGPPGTGKTRTLTAYIKAAVDTGNRVLVTAHSNQAIDNLLVGDSTCTDPESGTLHAIAEDDTTDLTISRHGQRTENEVVAETYSPVPTGNANVVVTTTSGAASFQKNEFDVAVVDEATQASRAATLIAYDAAEKLVLAGDHKQLPPYSAADSGPLDEQRPSLFEALLNRYGDDLAVLLETQYRMHDAIAAFPNEQFYDGELETASRNAAWTLDGFEPLLGINLVGSEETRGANQSKINQREATAAARQVERLLSEGITGRDIGVITAYSAQVNAIRSELSQLDIPAVSDVDVDTVDSFQGSEREAIIVSLVRSNDENRSGFLTIPEEGPRRLNVALTRARKRLVVLADWQTLARVSERRSEAESCAPLYAALKDAIQAHGKFISQPP